MRAAEFSFQMLIMYQRINLFGHQFIVSALHSTEEATSFSDRLKELPNMQHFAHKQNFNHIFHSSK